MSMTQNPASPGGKLDWIINNWAESRTLEPIECEDGHLVSVQADGGHYCHDANGVDDRWREADQPLALPVRSVEVMTRQAPSKWGDYDVEGQGARSDVYGFVPVDEVRAFINSHGGEKGAADLAAKLDGILSILRQIADSPAPRVAYASKGDARIARANIQQFLRRPA